MLQAMNAVFPSTLKGLENNALSNGVIVVGNSGAGKSLLIGYLRGKKPQFIEQEGDMVYVYSADNSNIEAPKVGNGNDVIIKGCQVYGR